MAQPDMSYRRLGLLQVRLYATCMCTNECLTVSAHWRATAPTIAKAMSPCLREQGLAGGLMLSLSFVDLLPQSMQVIRIDSSFNICCATPKSCAFHWLLLATLGPTNVLCRRSAFCSQTCGSMAACCSLASLCTSSPSPPPQMPSSEPLRRRCQTRWFSVTCLHLVSILSGYCWVHCVCTAADATQPPPLVCIIPQASKQTVKAVNDERRQRKDVLMSGIITAIGGRQACRIVQVGWRAMAIMQVMMPIPIHREPPSAGIALHNFPEGIAVFLASMKSQVQSPMLTASHCSLFNTTASDASSQHPDTGRICGVVACAGCWA